MKALTTTEVAEVLNCNLQRVQILIREGKLPAINIAVGEKKPRWRVPQTALDEFMTPKNRPALKPVATRKRQRIDASVPKMFG
jgi:excisionase family DNA binding protein